MISASGQVLSKTVEKVGTAAEIGFWEHVDSILSRQNRQASVVRLTSGLLILSCGVTLGAYSVKVGARSHSERQLAEVLTEMAKGFLQQHLDSEREVTLSRQTIRISF